MTPVGFYRCRALESSLLRVLKNPGIDFRNELLAEFIGSTLRLATSRTGYAVQDIASYDHVAGAQPSRPWVSPVALDMLARNTRRTWATRWGQHCWAALKGRWRYR